MNSPPPPSAIPPSTNEASSDVFSYLGIGEDTGEWPIEHAWYNPVGYIQSGMEKIHQLTGLPWWATVICTTLAVRGVLLPLNITALKHNRKMLRLQPELAKLRANSAREQATSDPYEAKAKMARKTQSLFKKHNLSPLKGVVAPLAQIPAFISLFWSVREMSLNHPEFTTGGIGWIENLAATDSTMILPVLTGLTTMSTVLLGLDRTQHLVKTGMSSGVKTVMAGFSLVLIPMSSMFPSGLFLYWIPSTAVSLGLSLATRSPFLEKVMGLPDVSDLEALAKKTGMKDPVGEALKKGKELTGIAEPARKPQFTNQRRRGRKAVPDS